MNERVSIPGFPRYTVDAQGNVYSGDRKLKQETVHGGYLRVSLSNGKVRHKRFLVHRLVASAFIPNPHNYPQINHKDENKKNNSVSNLEWCTPLYNLQYSDVFGKARESTRREVICTTTGERFDSIQEACDKYSLSHGNISECCSGYRKSCGGMKWIYAGGKENA